jgi:predicted ester cyclase
MGKRTARAILTMLALAVLAIQSAGAGDSTAKTGATAEERNKALVRRYYDEVWNQMKLATVDDLFVEPFRSEPMKNTVTAVHFGIPDIHFQIDEIFAGEGDRVVVTFTASGTHSAELFGVPGTGKQINFNGIEIFRFKDGKIYEKQNSDSRLLLMQQVGALCKPGGPK